MSLLRTVHCFRKGCAQASAASRVPPGWIRGFLRRSSLETILRYTKDAPLSFSQTFAQATVASRWEGEGEWRELLRKLQVAQATSPNGTADVARSQSSSEPAGSGREPVDGGESCKRTWRTIHHAKPVRALHP